MLLFNITVVRKGFTLKSSNRKWLYLPIIPWQLSRKKRGEVSNYLGGRKKETKLSTVQCTRGGILFISRGSFRPAPGRRAHWVTALRFPHFLLCVQTSPLLFPPSPGAGFLLLKNGDDKSSRTQADGRTDRGVSYVCVCFPVAPEFNLITF